MESIENVDVSLIKSRVYNINTYDWGKFYTLPILQHGQGETRKQRRTDLIDAIVTFDIETTAIHEKEQSICYIWQACINGDIIIGRSLETARRFFDNLCRYLDDKTQVLCFVHNLAYEFHFLREIIPFSDVFSISKRHPLVARYRNIEFRCSYLLTNQSLGDFLDEMNVENSKTSMDYDIPRYPWTFITAKDAEYCINDVLGLYQGIKEKLRRENDTLYTLPLTSTGYTRREVKEVMYHVRGTKKFKDAIPDYKLHKLLYDAFRGGNTHANRWISSKIIENVLIHSKDIASSYPNALVKNKFPWKLEPFEIASEKMMRYIISDGKAVLTRIKLYGVELKDKCCGCPYIPKSKCSDYDDLLEDNGRVLEASHISMVITDVDFTILDRIYQWKKIEFSDSYVGYYDYLPIKLRKLIIKYFTMKTSLKDRPGEEIRYNLFKARINAIYGLMVQNPCKALIDYDTEAKELFEFNKTPLEEIYYKNVKTPYTLYQWGVWCTAYARKALDDGLSLIEKTPGALFLYCDTDSLKYIGDVDFSEYNQQQIDTDLELGAYAQTVKGKTKYLGIYEDEDDMCSFITHGAKKYAYLIQRKKQLDNQFTLTYKELHLTCAGVSKKEGAKELGDIHNFDIGFVFHKSAGKELKYNDHPTSKTITVDGHMILLYSNIYMRDSTYTVKHGDKYQQLLDMIDFNLQNIEYNI